jgi:hypothetical protein
VVSFKNKLLMYFDYIYKRKIFFFISYFLILLLLFFIFGKINNNIQWQDEHEYIQRGLGISFIDLNFTTLYDGFRPPLFPIIVKLLSFISSDNILVVIKIFHIFLISVLPFILMCISKRIKDNTYNKILYYSSFTQFLFIPNLFFIQFAYAELISIFFFNIFIYLIIFIFFSEKKIYFSFILALIFTILSYLKGNLILLIILFIIFLKNFKKNFRFNFYLSIFLFLMIFPWIFYMYKITNEFKFTNSQHLNRLYGLGYDIIVLDQNLDTIHGKFLLKKYKSDNMIIDIYRKPLDKISYLNFDIHNQINLDFQLTREKIFNETIKELINYNIKERIQFSFLKILHLFGGSFRELRDIIVLSFSILGLVSIFLCSRYNLLRLIFYINILTLFALLFQTYFYHPTIRYSIFFFNTIILSFVGIIFFQKKKK